MSQIIQTIFWNLLFFASSFLYISDITLQRLFLFSDSEINISVVAPWSSFYVFKEILCTKQPFADVFKIDVLKIWRPSTLLKRDSNTVFLWILQNLYDQLFYRTNSQAASALNFALYFQVNSGFTTWIRELLFTWIDLSCSFICSFISVNFSSHVEILIWLALFHQINLMK